MKLVRDKIPDIIKDSGKTPETSVVSGELYKHMLARKLLEELEEFMQCPCAEEAGDMFEVCRSLFAEHKITMAEVSEAANKKKKLRGAFKAGLILHSVKG